MKERCKVCSHNNNGWCKKFSTNNKEVKKAMCKETIEIKEVDTFNSKEEIINSIIEEVTVIGMQLEKLLDKLYELKGEE